MIIIDFERKGNVVRFYLGKDGNTDYEGDGWEKYPYDRADRVDPKFISGFTDIAFPFDAMVLEPDCGEEYCAYTKLDMRAGILPCIIVVPPDVSNGSQRTEFAYWSNGKGVLKCYFGDRMNPITGLSMYSFSKSGDEQQIGNATTHHNDGKQANNQLPIPLWEKQNLTLVEAAEYFGIGQNKIRELSGMRNCSFVLFNGSKRLIKRKAFEKYLEEHAYI